MTRSLFAAALALAILVSPLDPAWSQDYGIEDSGMLAAEPVKKEPLRSAGASNDKKKPLSSLDDLAPEEKRKNELLFMEYEMAMNGINLRPSVENKARLLRVLEKLINAVCMPDLLTALSYAGGSDDPRCDRFVSQALALDSDNPAALCARDGIDAESCINSYANQNIDRYSPESSGASEVGLDPDVVRASAKWDGRNIEILSKQLDELLATFKAAKTDQLYIKVARQFRKILAIACKYNEVAYTREYSVPEVEAGQGGAGLMLDPNRRLTFVLGRGATPTPDPLDNRNLMGDSNQNKEEPIEFKRTRYVTNSCISVIEKYRSEDFADWSMVCYPHGFHTPRCLKALRQAKKRNLSARPRSPSASEKIPSGTGFGFSEF